MTPRGGLGVMAPCIQCRLHQFADGHTASNAPDLFRPPKLSGAGEGWGDCPGKHQGAVSLFRRCLFFLESCLFFFAQRIVLSDRCQLSLCCRRRPLLASVGPRAHRPRRPLELVIPAAKRYLESP